MHNEPGSSSRDGQPTNVDAPDQVAFPRDVEMLSGEFEVGADDENPDFQRVPEQLSEGNPSVEPQLQSSQSSEPQLPPPRSRTTTQHFERNVCARQATSSVPPVPSCEADLAFSASILEPACVSKKQWKKPAEASYLVTAEMFENPEDDWLATASSRARGRVEVNIRKLSSDERAQFRAPQDKEMHQKIRHSQRENHDDALGSHMESG